MVVLLQGNINNASYPTFLDETVELTPSRKDYVIEYTHTGNAIGAAEGLEGHDYAIARHNVCDPLSDRFDYSRRLVAQDRG